MTIHTDSQATLNELINTFVGVPSAYYRRVFSRMLAAPGYVPTFNPAAALLGPVWFGSRGLWSWFLGAMLLDILAWIRVAQGLFGDLSREARARADTISTTLDLRYRQIETARESGAASLEALQGAVASLEQARTDALAAAESASDQAVMILLTGILLLCFVRLVFAFTGNYALERQFILWRSDRSVASGLSMSRLSAATGLMVLSTGLTAVQFARPDLLPVLGSFPTDGNWRIAAGDWIQTGFDWTKVNGRVVFDKVTWLMRTLLDAIEVALVGTPWPVVALVIVMLAYLSAGVRVAIFTGAALSYLGLLDFWEKAMTTVALLGAAAMISITLGIPLGIYCARRPKVFSVVRPVLDFMQSMPSFVYLIPVVAFIGSGKPAGVVATMIFGSPPVIRFTVLGLQQVPETVREAARAFGATDHYLLWKVDLPLASRTIMAGVNQTILLSLAMVVVASLIGAKGLGEDVLQALQYAAAGQGILAGLAILFCAIILDRIVTGRRG